MDKNTQDQQQPNQPQLKSPGAEGWKAGISSGLTWFAGMSLFSVVVGKILGNHIVLPTRPPVLVKVNAPKIWDIIKNNAFGNALWAGMFGLFDASRAVSNTKHENTETLLIHENNLLRGQLDQAGEILNQTATFIQQAGQPAASHAEKALAEKAAAAEAKHTVH